MLKTTIKRHLLQRTLSTEMSAREQQLINELREGVRQIHFPQDVDEEWIRNQKVLQQKILQEDPRDFINWPVITKTMFHFSKLDEYLALRRSPRWSEFKDAIIEDKAGNPPRYHFNLSSSGNIIHHAYSILQLQQKEIGIDIKELKQVIEFGGGYGSLCRLFYALGFSGSYVIFDLPIFNQLQKYFLRSILTNDIFSRISLVNKLESLSFDKIDLFVALWSMSETPVQLRNLVLEKVASAKVVLIAYQDSFGGVNNCQFFADFAANNSQYRWLNYPIKHLPGNNYLLGVRK